MTTFTKETIDVASTKKEETKAVVVVPAESRLKADPKIWKQTGVLADMLSYCRPHNSKTERGFIGKFLVPIGVKFDKKGNAHKIINNPDGSLCPVIWSSHTDTVHTKKGMQQIYYFVDKDGDTIYYSEGHNASCLGADDTAGVWIMLEMIKAKIPGHYIFHRGEECGGVGSRWIAKECTEMLKNYNFAIAFDRRDTKSIITHQGSKMSASDEFAKLLAAEIGMGHEPDHTGMWTDTAAYVDDVAECTNVSVGYEGAHGKTEKLNVDYLFKLRDAMCKIDVSKFVATRKPGENTYKYRGHTVFYDDFGYNGGYHGSYSYPDETKRPKGGFTTRELDTRYGFNAWMQWFGWDGPSGFWKPLAGVVPPNPEKWRKKKQKNLGVTKGWVKCATDLFAGASELREMKLLISDNPAIIADLLDGQGYGPLEIREYIKGCGGLIYDDIPGY